MLDEINWQTFGAIVMFFAVAFGMAKYVFYVLDKHKEQVDGRFKDHKDKLLEHGKDIKLNGERLGTTREEMHRDFVKHDHLNKVMEKNGETLTAIFERVNSMANNLHQVIGALNGKVKEND